MSSHFESLPVELLGAILSRLSISEVAKFQQCSKALNQSLDAYVFSLPIAVNKLMQWGCVHAEKWAIEKALSHGADINVVDIPRAGTNRGPAVVRTSTLCVAARRYNYEIFQFLLDLGAQLNSSRIDGPQSRALRERLFDPRKPRLMKQCFDHGVQDQISDLQTGINNALCSSVNLGCDLPTCGMWLDLGADPTELVGKTQRDRKSALALAILSDSVPLVRMLLSRSPPVRIRTRGMLYAENGVEYEPSCPWDAVPMLAAARVMGIHGETTMMDILLESGGDINLAVKSHLLGIWDMYDFQWPCPLTPLLMYVLTINWRADIVLLPSRGVSILFERGVTMEKPEFYTGDNRREPFPLWMLFWRKWRGIRCLCNDEMYAVLKLLIQHGAAKGAVAKFLLPPDGPLTEPRSYLKVFALNTEDYHIVMGRWRSLLDLILVDENFEDSLAGEIDGLLYEFLTRTMKSNLHETIHLPEPCLATILFQFIEESHPVTIQKLLEKGANINAKPKNDRYLQKGILEHLDMVHGEAHQSVSPHGVDYRNPLQLKRQRSFVSMLVGLGAEPPEDWIEHWSLEKQAKNDTTYQLWLRALRGEVLEDERFLWNPSAEFG
ncbi:hypothetical protein G7Z17_g10164 [Cylindrodendrum hubeiense]|uniref:F-box domain-containing protein n=1 Tax=Cylindrodendrum hubeiense TaxID=595255 RepID=A0A9P5H372_9HYPO|nr:hypothetical protein G7Z17_g10164 [Cylindrodendrum hubeiense]